MKIHDLRAAITAELEAEQRQTVLRYSVTLTGQVAEALEALHREVGGDAVLSRGELTSRLLHKLLLENPERRPRRGCAQAPPAGAGAEVR